MCNVLPSWSQRFLLRKWRSPIDAFIHHLSSCIEHSFPLDSIHLSSVYSRNVTMYTHMYLYLHLQLCICIYMYMYLYFSINYGSVKKKKSLQLNHSLPAFDRDQIYLPSAYNRNCTLIVQLRRDTKVFSCGID